MSAPSKEELDATVAEARQVLEYAKDEGKHPCPCDDCVRARPIVALADENDRLRAEVADVRARWDDCEKHNTELGVANERHDRERAEVVALLEDPRRGHDEWWSRAISLLAKLGGTP